MRWMCGVTDHTALERELADAFFDGVRRCKQLGYNPAYFVRMLEEHGAVATARTLITAPNPSDGFSRLWELGHLELSVEAIVVRRRFAPLFSHRELALARQRLEALGYSSRDDSN